MGQWNVAYLPFFIVRHVTQRALLKHREGIFMFAGLRGPAGRGPWDLQLHLESSCYTWLLFPLAALLDCRSVDAKESNKPDSQWAARLTERKEKQPKQTKVLAPPANTGWKTWSKCWKHFVLINLLLVELFHRWPVARFGSLSCWEAP